MSKRKHEKERAAPRHRKRLRYAAINPGVSTLMLVNPPSRGKAAAPPSKDTAQILRRLNALQEQLRRERRTMPSQHRPKPSVRARPASQAQLGLNFTGQPVVPPRQRHAAHRQSLPKRDASGRFRPRAGGAHRKANPSRGVKTLARARRSVRWERAHGRPFARGYVRKFFAHVNPAPGEPLTMAKQIGGTAAGFLGARLVGNLLPKIPGIGQHLSNLGPVMGNLATGALAYFLTGGERERWRAPLVTGIGLSLLDSIVRHFAPAAIQSYLGDYPSVGLLPGYDDSAMGYPMLPAYDGETGDFQVRPAPADYAVREATSGMENYVAQPVDGTADEVPGMGAYVAQPDGMSGIGSYVPEGAAGWDDGVSGPPMMSWFMPQYGQRHWAMQHPVVHRNRRFPYRIVIECPHPSMMQRALPPHVARPPMQLPLHVAVPQLPAPQTTIARPGVPAQNVTVAKPPRALAGGIFAPEDD